MQKYEFCKVMFVAMLLSYSLDIICPVVQNISMVKKMWNNLWHNLGMVKKLFVEPLSALPPSIKLHCDVLYCGSALHGIPR